VNASLYSWTSGGYCRSEGGGEKYLQGARVADQYLSHGAEADIKSVVEGGGMTVSESDHWCQHGRVFVVR
jgi:hypothetical protein